MNCKTCENWGPTIEELHSHTIICPDCKRYTYANLGVNCPAGMAVAFGASSAFEKMRQMDINAAGQIIDGQARLNAMALSHVPDNFPYPEKWKHYPALESNNGRRRKKERVAETSQARPGDCSDIRIVATPLEEIVRKSADGRLRGTSSDGVIEGVH